MKLIPKHTSGSPIKALKLSRKDVRNLDTATSVEGYGDKVITDEYGNFIPASEIYKYGIVNSSGDMEGFIPEILVSPKYSITKEDLKPKLYSGNIANHPDAKYMSNAYLDAQIQKAKNTEEADKKAGEVNLSKILGFEKFKDLFKQDKYPENFYESSAIYRMDPYTMRKLGFTDYADKEGGYKYKFFDDGKMQTRCAYTANRLASRFRKPTAGNAWTTNGIYGDSVLVDGNQYGQSVIGKAAKYLPNWTVAIMDLVPNFLAGQDVRSKVGNIKLQTGDIVDIYMPFSPSSKRAAYEGRTQKRTSTHTGRIYMKPINGKSVPFIIHNINGNVIAEPYGNLSNRITRISRPVESPSNKSHLRYDLPNNRYMRVYEDGREKPVNENELR